MSILYSLTFIAGINLRETSQLKALTLHRHVSLVYLSKIKHKDITKTIVHTLSYASHIRKIIRRTLRATPSITAVKKTIFTYISRLKSSAHMHRALTLTKIASNAYYNSGFYNQGSYNGLVPVINARIIKTVQRKYSSDLTFASAIKKTITKKPMARITIAARTGNRQMELYFHKVLNLIPIAHKMVNKKPFIADIGLSGEVPNRSFIRKLKASLEESGATGGRPSSIVYQGYSTIKGAISMMYQAHVAVFNNDYEDTIAGSNPVSTGDPISEQGPH